MTRLAHLAENVLAGSEHSPPPCAPCSLAKEAMRIEEILRGVLEHLDETHVWDAHDPRMVAAREAVG